MTIMERDEEGETPRNRERKIEIGTQMKPVFQVASSTPPSGRNIEIYTKEQ